MNLPYVLLFITFCGRILGQGQADLHHLDSLTKLSFDSSRSNPAFAIAKANEAKLYFEQNGFDKNSIAYANVLKTWAQAVGQNEPEHLAEAIRINDQAIQIFKQFPSLKPLAVSSAINLQANLYRMSGKLWEADSCYRLNIEIRRKLLPPGDRQMVLPLRNYAAFLNLRGDLLSAEPYFEEALHILENTEGKEHSSTKSVLYQIGANLIERGNYTDGLAAVLDAYRFYETNLPDDYFLGYISNSIGTVYKLTGDYDRAIPYLEKATRTKNRDFEKTGYFRNLGEGYSLKHDYTSAQDCFMKALDFVKNMPENSEDRLKIHAAMAQNEVNNGHYDKGIGQFRQVASDFRKYDNLTAEFHHDILAQFGNAFLANKQLDSATLYLRQANTIALQAKPLIIGTIAENYGNLSKCYNGTQALQLADSAIYYSTSHPGQPFYGQNVSFIPEYYAARLRAYVHIYKQTSDNQLLPKIESSALETMLKLEQCRLQAATDGARQLLAAENSEIVAQVVEAFLLLHTNTRENRFFNTAFEMAERGKNLSLSEAIRSANMEHIDGVPDSLLAQKRSLESSLAWLEKTIWEKTGNTTNLSLDPLVQRFYKNKLETTEKLLAVNAQLEALVAWKRVRQPSTTISIATVQQQLLHADGNQVFLEHVMAEDKMIQFVVRRDTAFVHVFPFDLALKNAAATMRDSLAFLTDIEPGSTRAKIAMDSFILASHLLYKKIIAPVLPQLRENILIVTDGPLGQIPYDALLMQMPKGYTFDQFPFLIKKYNVHFTWTATLQLELDKNRQNTLFEQPFVAFAPFGTPDTSLDHHLQELVMRSTGQHSKLDTLKYSRLEATAAAQLMHGLAFSDSTATKSTFLQYARSARVLHLATHASSEAKNSDFGWIAFYSNKRDTADLLYTREIYPLQLNADLVVLSACESGTGKLRAGEGTISLGRAFAWAGAQSVIASNWKANDASTERLMIQFYKNLSVGQSRSNALRNAKLAMLTEPSKVEKKHQPALKTNWSAQANPVYWAGFALMGNGN
jgi:CHAT domain-containing protein